MRKLFLAISLIILSGWTHGAPPNNGIYSVFTASTGTGSCSASTKATTATCIVYLSSSGSDSNNCVADPPINNSFATPCQTIAHGITLLRDQSPDWLLLKKGDTFVDQTFDQWLLRGMSVTQTSSNPNTYTGLMVIGAWPTTAGVRPIVKTNASTQEFCLNVQGGGGSHSNDLSFTAMQSINCYNYKRDPTNVSYTANIDNTIGLQVISRNTGPPVQQFMLFEDCVFAFNTVGVNIQGDNVNITGTVIFNANVVQYNYRGSSGDIHAEGLLQENITTPIITNNVFNHNGWYNNTGTGQAADVFNQNVYLNNDNMTSAPATITGNIILSASSDGLQARAGGTVTNNYFAGNDIAGFVDYAVSSTTENVITNGEDHSIGSGIGGDGFTTQNQSGNSNGSIMNHNIVANQTSKTGSPNGLLLDSTTTGDTATNNIVCNWTAGFTNSGTSNTVSGNTSQTANCTGIGPDPSHATIENYDSTILGGPGTLADFATQVSTQSKDFYNANLTAGVVNNFFRTKLGMANYP
jgi:hypothetical protein